MLVDPKNAEVVRSPTTDTSVSTYVTRYTYTRTLSYSDTHDGYFMVWAAPSPTAPFMINQTVPRTPTSGSISYSGSVQAGYFGPNASPVGAMKNGLIPIHTEASGEVPVVSVLLSQITAANGTKPGFRFTADVGADLRINIANHANATRKYGVYCLQNGSWDGNIFSEWHLNAGQSQNKTHTVTVSSIDAVAIFFHAASGSEANPSGDAGVTASIDVSAGSIPASAAPGSVAQFVRPELADEAAISEVRISAMSLMVSPTGSMLNKGGLMFVVRTRARNLESSTGIQGVMDKIGSFNEGQIWRSGPLEEGGYCYYVPDDMKSYTHKDYDSLAYDDNVLCQVGKMEPDNQIRIEASFIVEFYSPRQVFTKLETPVFSEDYERVLKVLKASDAVSGNDGHLDLIAGIGRQLKHAAKFAYANRALLGELAALFL